jgi:nucleoside-diphosphate-sugar epimerase
MSRTVLVLGATGGFGGAVARELLGRGRSVRALVRDPDRAARRLPAADALQVVRGDAMDLASLSEAAAGCGAIVHGVNYPYDRWEPFMPRATDNVAAAARAAKAVVLFPGNVFGLGAPAAAPFDETVVQRPNSRKGALRVRLEESLRRGVESGGFRVLVLRAAAYFGPTVRNGLVDMIFARAVAGRPISMFGDLDLPHQWAYVPDLARAAADLLDLADRLEPFEVVHFAGHVARRQREFLEMIAARAGRPGLAVNGIPWRLLEDLSSREAGLREMLELRHLYEGSLILDDPRRRELLPAFQATPIEEAVSETLASYRAETATPEM